MLPCSTRLIVFTGLLSFTACGFEKELFGEPEAAPAQRATHGADATMDVTRPLAGQVMGVSFMPRSVIFASGINQNGVEETHIVASTARNYCEHIRDGIDQHHSLRVVMRVVRYTGDAVAGQAWPGEYTQQQDVDAYDDTLGIPPPDQVPVRGGSGQALTAGVAHVRAGCQGQRLFAAEPRSSLTIDAHDFTGLRGHVSLLFEQAQGVVVDPNMLPDFNGLLPHRPRAAPIDGLDFTQPIRVGGTFTATPCPWLATALAREAQAQFFAHQCL